MAQLLCSAPRTLRKSDWALERFVRDDGNAQRSVDPTKVIVAHDVTTLCYPERYRWLCSRLWGEREVAATAGHELPEVRVLALGGASWHDRHAEEQ